MQQAGQVLCLDQNDAHEQSLGQSDGSLTGPEQTLNQSNNQSILIQWYFTSHIGSGSHWFPLEGQLPDQILYKIPRDNLP